MNHLLKKLMGRVYMEGADDGSGGGGGGGDDAAAAKAKADADAAAAAAAKDKGGKSGPTDEEARLLKENMKKKEENQRLAAEAAALQEKLKQFEGIDAAAVRKMLEEKTKQEEDALAAKGDWERLKTRMAEEHGKEVKTLQEKLQAAMDGQSNLAKVIDDLSIGGQFGQSQFITAETVYTPSKARTIYGAHFDLVDGEVVGYDKPKGAANRTAIVDAYGNPVSFDAALRKIVESDPEKDQVLRSKVKAGAGSDSKKQTGQQSQNQSGEQLTGMSKIAKGLGSLKVQTNG